MMCSNYRRRLIECLRQYLYVDETIVNDERLLKVTEKQYFRLCIELRLRWDDFKIALSEELKPVREIIQRMFGDR
jgi:hypothetical protein